ncbi:hypothetical protein [Azospirillum doebereinerae]
MCCFLYKESIYKIYNFILLFFMVALIVPESCGESGFQCRQYCLYSTILFNKLKNIIKTLF